MIMKKQEFMKIEANNTVDKTKKQIEFLINLDLEKLPSIESTSINYSMEPVMKHFKNIQVFLKQISLNHLNGLADQILKKTTGIGETLAEQYDKSVIFNNGSNADTRYNGLTSTLDNLEQETKTKLLPLLLYSQIKSLNRGEIESYISKINDTLSDVEMSKNKHEQKVSQETAELRKLAGI